MENSVTISSSEYEELKRKAKLYDEMVEARRKGANKINAISAEERRARAMKAVEARIKKYGQKRRTDS